MLLPKKLPELKKILLIVFAVIIISLIGYLLYINFSDSNVKTAKTFSNKIEALNVLKISTRFESDFLSKSLYLNLKSGVKLPLTVERSGRSNPFRVIPFSLLSN